MRERGWRKRAERGQMAVELAVVLPVCIVVALVVFNLCRFVEACATFDRVAPDAVIAQGVSPAGEQSSLSAAGQVRSSIQSALDMSSCEVTVQVSGAPQEAGGWADLFRIASADNLHLHAPIPAMARIVCDGRRRLLAADRTDAYEDAGGRSVQAWGGGVDGRCDA